ncbi:hypothetical protein [Candidatus Rickettsiella isopodorum]|jgi:hypothetical protein|uniref:hypothetical protein n=1 Tax=Candidatus Rickettsiella isopodorum TaxID=1225476 RepID=UPI000B1809E1|nr:hypothetical protein [Candidatus Rickettsiella isopodorum]
MYVSKAILPAVPFLIIGTQAISQVIKKLKLGFISHRYLLINARLCVGKNPQISP